MTIQLKAAQLVVASDQDDANAELKAAQLVVASEMQDANVQLKAVALVVVTAAPPVFARTFIL